MTGMRRSVALVVANQTLGGAELERVIHERIQQAQGRFYILVPSIDPDQEATDWVRGFESAEAAEAAEAAGATSDEARQAVDDAVRRRERMVGQAHVRAERRLRQMIDKIEAAGGQATGEVGGPDPTLAVEAVLARDAFAEVIISTLPAGLSRWLKADDLPANVSRMTDTPVTLVEAEP